SLSKNPIDKQGFCELQTLIPGATVVRFSGFLFMWISGDEEKRLLFFICIRLLLSVDDQKGKSHVFREGKSFHLWI
ncbi:hypothetical protein LINPERPRIM_LOCUS31666, partial [Linum perenne]